LFACTGIAYNHESPRRGFEFVTRKITSGVAKIHLGLSTTLELGNISARRDWGYAPEYVAAMVAMLEQDQPDDYVLATGVLHSVEEVLKIAFAAIGKNYQDHCEISDQYVRPEAQVPLVGDAAKAKKILGFAPKKPFAAMIEEMVESDINLLKKQS
jgi:GDPmannose 4,6-dehydratase